LGSFKSFKPWNNPANGLNGLNFLNVVTGVPSPRRSVVFQRQAEPWCNFLTQLLKSPGAAAVDQHGSASFQT
jgi:hypothetical protein